MVRFTSIVVMLFVVIGLVSAQATKPATVKLSISGMSCEGCASKVDKAIRGVKGVKDVKVDLKSESAEVVLASASVKADALVKAVVKAGYKAEVGEKPAGAKTDKKESCCSEEEKKKEGKCDGNCSKETKEKKKAAGKS